MIDEPQDEGSGGLTRFRLRRRRIRPEVLTLLVILSLGSVLLYVSDQRLERMLEREQARVEGLAELVEETEQGSISRADFDAARAELEGVVADTAERLRTLEEFAGARSRVIADAADSVLFLQGSYGFIDPQTQRPLRYFRGQGERPLRLPDGRTLVTTGGDGPLVQIFYTGTGFMVGDGILVTNRHVAYPWEFEPNAQFTLNAGFAADRRALIGFLPGREQPVELEPLVASDDADVALLRIRPTARAANPDAEAGETLQPAPTPDAEPGEIPPPAGAPDAEPGEISPPAGTPDAESGEISPPAATPDAGTGEMSPPNTTPDVEPVEVPPPNATADVAPDEIPPPLVLAETDPAPGDEVVVMGYPAGVEALLARADPQFAEGLLSRGPVTFWDVGRALAVGGYIEPLTTQGIVGQVTDSMVVYDAETTRGGSGGPVVTLDGAVVAVNTAVLAQFAGSNLGVPVRHVRELLEAAAAQRATIEGGAGQESPASGKAESRR